MRICFSLIWSSIPTTFNRTFIHWGPEEGRPFRGSTFLPPEGGSLLFKNRSGGSVGTSTPARFQPYQSSAVGVDPGYPCAPGCRPDFLFTTLARSVRLVPHALSLSILKPVFQALSDFPLLFIAQTELLGDRRLPSRLFPTTERRCLQQKIWHTQCHSGLADSRS